MFIENAKRNITIFSASLHANRWSAEKVYPQKDELIHFERVQSFSIHKSRLNSVHNSYRG